MQRSEMPLIFDIIRNSFVDGPGIRTAVFFKGCNLRCAWCHNPESQSPARQIMLYKNKCTDCGRCREVCPSHLEACTLCGKCALCCPRDARMICGREISPAELIAELVKDKEFYAASGGGVTFSGGECMLYPDFLAEVLRGCREAGIHTAVDTAGCVPFSSFQKIMPYTDMFLYDIKLATDELHRRWTGVSNKLILDNIRRLSNEFDGDIIIRIPVIGGVNDSEQEMRAIADEVRSVRHARTELLPYHKMGEHKYRALGTAACAFTVPSENVMKKLEEMIGDRV